MSQQRSRKSAGAEQMAQGRATTKASGDQCLTMKNSDKKYQSAGDNAGNTIPSNVQSKQRSKSKSKIPKSLRNDLENALVGLCDVWFEEIKPHLVRNNIKVHVHSGAGAGPASGDHQTPPHPRRRPYVNSARYCSTQQIASKAPSSKPPTLSYQQRSSPARHHSPNQNPCRNRNMEKHAKHEIDLPHHTSRGRVPRLCHTYSFPPSSPRIKVKRRPAIDLTSCHSTKHFNHQHLTRIPETDKYIPHPTLKNSAATVVLSKQSESRGRQQQPRFPNQGVGCSAFRDAVLAAPPAAAFLNINVNKTSSRVQQNKQRSALHDPHDLVDIIAKRNEKELKLLYKSPPRDESPSIMNLLHTGFSLVGRTADAIKKMPPWR
ncbi:unnamed protein product [Diatraea saccharalis]|uniref:Uncharacterized protein n=1 Tax=Diatraea saccharalis TaxID=40085 RepID=A0A9N9WKP3_9NEOP|nr:unnamed protein product [Diatraea saccharalis]